MYHDFDFTYRDYEITIAHDPSGYMCDIRDNDGELLQGYCAFFTLRAAVIGAIDFVEQTIYDQTHFTAGISL